MSPHLSSRGGNRSRLPCRRWSRDSGADRLLSLRTRHRLSSKRFGDATEKPRTITGQGGLHRQDVGHRKERAACKRRRRRGVRQAEQRTDPRGAEERVGRAPGKWGLSRGPPAAPHLAPSRGIEPSLREGTAASVKALHPPPRCGLTELTN